MLGEERAGRIVWDASARLSTRLYTEEVKVVKVVKEGDLSVADLGWCTATKRRRAEGSVLPVPLTALSINCRKEEPLYVERARLPHFITGRHTRLQQKAEKVQKFMRMFYGDMLQ